MDLIDKTVLVTGGSRGIGKAISLEFAKAGAAVALTYREHAHAAQVVVDQIQASNGRVRAIQMDVRDRASVRRAVATTEEYFGGLDILVNNAGINKPTDFD